MNKTIELLAKAIIIPGFYLVMLLRYPSVKRRNEERNGTRPPLHYREPEDVNKSVRRPITPVTKEPSKTRRQKKQAYEHQDRSILFAKLPAELRSMIWNLYFCDTAHVYSSRGHMRSVPCIADTNGGHVGCYAQQNRSLHGAPIDARSGRLALALTCQRMYTETIRIMYAAPLFDFSFDGMVCLAHLDKVMLAPRFHAITKIAVHVDCRRRLPRLDSGRRSHFSKLWLGTMKNLESMKGLKEVDFILHIDILPGWTEWMHEREAIEKSLEGVKERGFVVKGLPWDQDSHWEGGYYINRGH